MMAKLHSRPLSLRQHQPKKRMWISILILPASCCLVPLKAFKRGRASTKAWIIFANQVVVTYLPSPLSKRAVWQRKPALHAAGSPDEPSPHLCLPYPGQGLALPPRTLFPLPHCRGVVEKASRYLSLLEPLATATPNSPASHFSGPHRALPYGSLLSSHFLRPPSLSTGLRIRGAVRTGVSHPPGTRLQGQKDR